MRDMPHQNTTVHIWDDVGQLFIYAILLLLVVAVLYALKLLIGSTKDDEKKE